MAAGKGEGPKYEIRGGKIAFRFSLDGRRYYMATGWPDTKTARLLAEDKANQMKSDILWGRFDYADLKLLKYKPGLAVAEPEVSQFQWPTLADLHGQYQAFREGDVGKSRMGAYLSYARILASSPHDIEDGGGLCSWVRSQTTPDYASKTLGHALAVFNWAVARKLIPYNPLEDSKLLIPRSHPESTIEFWERHERNMIIDQFGERTTTRRYQSLVEFLFLVGCRPSEALGLRWEHVYDDCQRVLFKEALVSKEDGAIYLRNGLKTQAARMVSLGPRSSRILAGLPQGKKDDFVFPSVNGKHIHWSGFRSGPWHRVLKDLSYCYKKPYSTRHTMITLALRGDPTADPQIPPMPIADLAALVGNSPETILRHYAGTAKNLRLAE